MITPAPGVAPDIITPRQWAVSQGIKVHEALTAQLHERMPAARGGGSWAPLVVAHTLALPYCRQHAEGRLDATCRCDPAGRFMAAYVKKGLVQHPGGHVSPVTYIKPHYVFQGPGSTFMEPSVDFIARKFARLDVCSQDYDGQLDDTLIEEYDAHDGKDKKAYLDEKAAMWGELQARFKPRALFAGTSFGV